VASAQWPDVVLLDMMMPGLDGAATFDLLRSDPKAENIPVLLFTAKIQPKDLRRFSELGAAGMIAKPFDPSTLGAEIADKLGCTLDA
jgi:CheY-like chemotaxis protein